ncbi:hypothetical protein [Neotamlana nanhaiensis]|uniref:hypothetical protein n=1 Tax=Neotamlana nanhaiensis TaxID=1382798 RepID=UPI0005CC1389|nr:hypothetical protein [Tamlana nanhaiensis]
MAFVTKSVFHKLITYIKLKNDVEFISRPFFEENIYHKGQLHKFFNQYELKRLYAYKLLLEDQDSLSYFTFNEKKEDDYKFVFYKGGYLKYHLYKDCQALNSNFKDYHIPYEVQERGKELVNTYRGWFKTMKFKEKFERGEIDNFHIVNKYNNLFRKTHNLDKLNIDYTIAKEVLQSGKEYIDKDYDVKMFEDKLEQIISYRNSLCQGETLKFLAKVNYLRDKHDLEIISKFKELHEEHPRLFSSDFIKNYGISNAKTFWNQHYSLKTRVSTMLEEYFRWTFQFHNMNFDKLQLEDFGLRCCKFCSNIQQIKEN